MAVVPLPPHGRWILDLRGGGRAVRVSARVEAGFVTLSTWKAQGCVSTVRLLPDEAAELMAAIAEGLARLANSTAGSGPAGSGPTASGPTASVTAGLEAQDQ